MRQTRPKGRDKPLYGIGASGKGEVAEWLKALAWKACIPKGIEGSNPSLTAILKTALDGRFFIASGLWKTAPALGLGKKATSCPPVVQGIKRNRKMKEFVS